MGMDLKNAHDEWFQCRGVAWSMTLMVARQFGWKPAGTLPPLYEGEDVGKTHIIAMHQPQRFLSWLAYFPKKLTGRAHDTWDASNYATNDGQRVTDADAKALGEVLARVRDEIVGSELQKEYFPDPDAWFTPFVVYLRKGGFEIH